jgi:hypothetical protein
MAVEDSEILLKDVFTEGKDSETQNYQVEYE